MCTKHLFSHLCVLGLVFVFVQAGKVTVQLTLISYSNPTGRDWLNQRCDTHTPCDTYLKLCLDRIKGSYHGFWSDLANCFFYSASSAGFVGHSPTFTGSNLGFPNPLEYNISDWQGGFQVKVATFDADKFTRDDVIDVILYKYEELPAKSLQEAGTGITEDVPGKGPGAQTSLKFKLLVYCSEFYYYPTSGDPSDPCSLYCKPEDSSTGHYNCTETGQIICLPGWINETSNCLVPTNIKTETTTNTPTVITGPGLDTAQVIGIDPGVFFGDNRNLVIGLMVGLFLLLLIVVLLIALLLRNRRKRLQEENDTAVAGQLTTTTASNSAVIATHDNPLYLNQANSALAESPYSEVDYTMVKMPLGGSNDHGTISDAVGKAKEAGTKTDSYYNRNLNYYVLDHRNHHNP